MDRRGSKPGEHRGGRKPGTPNKKTILLSDAVETMRDEGVDPLRILAQAAKGKIKSPLRIRAAIELAKYGWAQRKAIEVTGLNGGPMEMSVAPVQVVVRYEGNDAELPDSAT